MRILIHAHLSSKLGMPSHVGHSLATAKVISTLASKAHSLLPTHYWTFLRAGFQPASHRHINQVNFFNAEMPSSHPQMDFTFDLIVCLAPTHTQESHGWPMGAGCDI